MQTIRFVGEQLKQNRELLEGTLADVAEEAHATPPGILNPISATYAHVVAGEDGFVNGLLRGSAVFQKQERDLLSFSLLLRIPMAGRGWPTGQK